MRLDSSGSGTQAVVMYAYASPCTLQLLLWNCRRVYADMNVKPTYRFGHLQMNPFVSVCCSSCLGYPCSCSFMLHCASFCRIHKKLLSRYPHSAQAAAVPSSQPKLSQSSIHSCLCRSSCNYGSWPVLTGYCVHRLPAAVLCLLLQYEQRNKMFPHRKYTRREE
jgi:hypothetical protein